MPGESGNFKSGAYRTAETAARESPARAMRQPGAAQTTLFSMTWC